MGRSFPIRSSWLPSQSLCPSPSWRPFSPAQGSAGFGQNCFEHTLKGCVSQCAHSQVLGQAGWALLSANPLGPFCPCLQSAHPHLAGSAWVLQGDQNSQTQLCCTCTLNPGCVIFRDEVSHFSFGGKQNTGSLCHQALGCRTFPQETLENSITFRSRSSSSANSIF